MPPKKPKGSNNNNSMKRSRGSGGYQQQQQQSGLDLTQFMAMQSGAVDPAMLMLMNSGGSSQASLLPLLMANSSGANTTTATPSTSIDPQTLALMASMQGSGTNSNDLLTLMMLQRHQQKQGHASASVPGSENVEEDIEASRAGGVSGHALQDTCDRLDENAAELAKLKARDTYRDEHLDRFLGDIPTKHPTFNDALAACDAEGKAYQDLHINTPGRQILSMVVHNAKASNDLAIKLAAEAAAEQATVRCMNAYRAEQLQQCEVVIPKNIVGASPKKTKVIEVDADHRVSKADLVDVSALLRESRKIDKSGGDDETSDGRTTRSKKQDKYIAKPLTVLNTLLLRVPKLAREGLGTKLGKDAMIPTAFSTGSQPLRDVITKQVSTKVEEKDVTSLINKFKIYEGSTRPSSLAKVVGDIIWILAEADDEFVDADCKISTTLFLNPV